VALRDALFRRFLLRLALPELVATEIHNPRWGDLAARLGCHHSSLPRRERERLGSTDATLADLAEAIDAEPGRVLAGMDAGDAVDFLFTIADLRGRSTEEIEDLADLAGALAEEVAGRSGPPAWPGSARTDEDLLDSMTRPRHPAARGDNLERLGPRGRIGTLSRQMLAAGLARFRQQQLALPARIAAAGLRRLAAEPISLLIGDVFAYLSSRGTRERPGEIVRLVGDALDRAQQDGPLVIVAHSMGGNIVYDIVSHFRPDLEVECLVTVGSQVGLFEELSLFAASDPELPSAVVPRVPALPQVRRWINIVDPADPLAYRVDPIFTGPVEYDYASREPWAHTAYFRQPMFHRRLALRVAEATR
jgi:hypothetical protein